MLLALLLACFNQPLSPDALDKRLGTDETWTDRKSTPGAGALWTLTSGCTPEHTFSCDGYTRANTRYQAALLLHRAGSADLGADEALVGALKRGPVAGHNGFQNADTCSSVFRETFEQAQANEQCRFQSRPATPGPTPESVQAGAAKLEAAGLADVAGRLTETLGAFRAISVTEITARCYLSEHDAVRTVAFSWVLIEGSPSVDGLLNDGTCITDLLSPEELEAFNQELAGAIPDPR